jgi:type VI protein secretion system component VasK
MKRHNERGAINGSIIAIVALVLLVIIFGSFGIWSYLNYTEQKTNVEEKIVEASAAAVLQNTEKMQKEFEAAEKQPMRQFLGPADYGRLTFDYPKTWSAYQATDVSQGGGATYEAYLNPILVPPVSDATKFAIRVTIEQKIFDKALEIYAPLIKKGSLKSSVYSDGIHTGTRLEGSFNKDIIGTAVLIKMRDRTLTIRTDGDVFKADYDALLKTVSFNE